MAKSICHIVPGVQPENLPSRKKGEQDGNSVSPPMIRPVPPDDFERETEQPAVAPPQSPREEQSPRPRARPRKSPAREQVPGQHEIRSLVRRQKQPSQQRPPSARDVHIYERAVIQEAPQRQVAEEFGITQGAVSRKCAKVIAWISRCGRKELSGMNDAERGRYVVRFAEQKYDFYREQSEAAHLRSLQDQVILVETGTREASGTPGQFEGVVTIRKTTRASVFLCENSACLTTS